MSEIQNAIIVNESNYEETLSSIDQLMAKGSQNLSKEEEARLETMALAVQQYEQDIYGDIPPPSTPEGIAELESCREKLKQQQQQKDQL